MGFRLLPDDDAAMRLRLQRVLMALVSYWMFLPLLWIGSLADQVSMGWGGAAVLGGLATLASVLAFVAIRAGWSRRFRDPSLMVPQLVVAILLALGMIRYTSGETRSVLLLLFVATYFFGLFGLDTRRFLVLTVGTSLGYLLTAAWELASAGASREAWLLEALRFCALLVITVWLSFIGGYFTRLRQALREQHSALAKANAMLREQSIRDDLTRVYNRRHLMERLQEEHERASRYGQRFVVALLDIDHFKSFNDRFGHAVGDEVLVQFADLLLQQSRSVDKVGHAPRSTFGRYGGEEFMMIMPGTSLAGGVACLDRVREVVERTPFATAAGALGVTFSAGLAGYRAGDSVKDLLSRADEALYRAKELGRNRLEPIG